MNFELTKLELNRIKLWKENPDIFLEEYFYIKLLPYQKRMLRLLLHTPIYLRMPYKLGLLKKNLEMEVYEDDYCENFN